MGQVESGSIVRLSYLYIAIICYLKSSRLDEMSIFLYEYQEN